MPQATRIGDFSTGHDDCVPRPLETGSTDVLINGKPAGRQGDLYAAHTCLAHIEHRDEISGGSATVLINGKPAARAGDAVSIGGAVADGSLDVLIGG